MSRITDAFKRTSPSSTVGAPDAAPMLNEYVQERHSRHDEPAAALAAAPKPPPHRLAPAPVVVGPEPAAPPVALATAHAESEGERLIDVQQIGDYLGFVARAVLRNRVLAAGTLGAMLAATVATALFWPKAYSIDARLLLQRNEVMASLVNPGRTISREAESPTHAAEEIVLQRDNLLSLIRETDVVREWQRSRAGLLRVKDWVYGLLFRPLTDDERLDAMVGLLEDRLHITATLEGAVTFDLRWPDGQVGYQIVDRAIQNFLQVRKQNETSAIADSIAILDRSVQTLEAQVSQTISEVPKRRPVTPVRRPTPAPATLIPSTPSGPPAELVARATKTKAALDAKAEEVARLDNGRRQQLAEAQGRLAQATAVYTEGHPTIVALRQSIAQMQREPADLTAARQDLQNLQVEYEAITGAIQSDRNDADLAARREAARLAASAEQPFVDFGALAGNAETNDPISLRLKVELAELATVRERANAARAELSSAQAGFKYQYSMIRPPQVPRRAITPNIPAILAGGAVASLLLAVVAAVARDVARGRILEPWQVERLVGVPVSVRL